MARKCNSRVAARKRDKMHYGKPSTFSENAQLLIRTDNRYYWGGFSVAINVQMLIKQQIQRNFAPLYFHYGFSPYIVAKAINNNIGCIHIFMAITHYCVEIRTKNTSYTTYIKHIPHPTSIKTSNKYKKLVAERNKGINHAFKYRAGQNYAILGYCKN